MPVPFLSTIRSRVTKRALAGDAPTPQRKADETLCVLRVPAAKKRLYYHGNDKVVAEASLGAGQSTTKTRRRKEPTHFFLRLRVFVVDLLFLF
ncbi:MAG: hypothetical protein DMG10_15850 [Acidobacteria bacterium]|nr:MAG: hypothetical protein DMG10_15850 [Acidobacteriota bacterium]